MSKLNHLYNGEKIIYLIKCIRNGEFIESLSEYTVSGLWPNKPDYDFFAPLFLGSPVSSFAKSKIY